jgi:peptidoglycan/xylan/chitin deacetylase (PgdA/CDA1 family)
MLTLLKRRGLPRLCSWVPLDWWHGMVDVELMLPHWHLASDDDAPHVSGLYRFRTLREFSADMEYFLKHYTPVTAQDVISHLDGVRPLPKRCFFPTFDDGFREVHDLIAPLLLEKGVPAGFFLITSAIDNTTLCYPQKKSLLIRAFDSRPGSSAQKEAVQLLDRAGVNGSSFAARIGSIHYLRRHILDELAPVLGCDFAAYVRSVKPYVTSEQVSFLLKSGFTVGGHSVDHPMYSELPLDEQVGQTQQSIDSLSQRFGFKCESFAFPYRDVNLSLEIFPQVFEVCGIKVSFTMDGLRPHAFTRNLNRFSMERTDLPAAQIIAKLFGRTVVSRS